MSRKHITSAVIRMSATDHSITILPQSRKLRFDLPSLKKHDARQIAAFLSTVIGARSKHVHSH